MKLNKDEQLFFGCKIDSKMREALSQAKPGDRKYFDDPNSEFLRVLEVGEERWIGKITKPGINIVELEDIQRNVVSILRRIAPTIRTSPAAIRIYSVSAVEEASSRQVEPVDTGPYIEY